MRKYHNHAAERQVLLPHAGFEKKPEPLILAAAPAPRTGGRCSARLGPRHKGNRIGFPAWEPRHGWGCGGRWGRRAPASWSASRGLLVLLPASRGPPPWGRPGFPRGSQAPSPLCGCSGHQRRRLSLGAGQDGSGGLPDCWSRGGQGKKKHSGSLPCPGLCLHREGCLQQHSPRGTENAVLTEPLGAKEHDCPQSRSQLQGVAVGSPARPTQTDQCSQLNNPSLSLTRKAHPTL